MLGDMTGKGRTINEIRLALKDLGINRKESDTHLIRYLRNSQVQHFTLYVSLITKHMLIS